MQRPVAPGLFTEGAAPRLLAGRRRADGRLVFPPPMGAEAEGFDEVALGREGRLWSYTVQRFPPKPPYIGGSEGFSPYGVGYVELPGEIIVEARLLADDFAKLKVGAPMRLTTTPFARDPDGTEVVTYAFELVTEGEAA